MMKHSILKNFSLGALFMALTGSQVNAKEKVGIQGNPNNKGPVVTAAGCDWTTAQTDLDINNVRTTILVGGDMWWDLSSAKYEVPINSNKHSLFAGALWIGGIDAGGQIKMAAQTYRQTGNDFYAGPLDTTAVDISPDQCQAYDRHWKMLRTGINAF